ncbi:MAG: alpha-glucuronidase [Candidatus Ornithomonoglobus sp.]
MTYSKLWLDYKPIEYDFTDMNRIYCRSSERAMLSAAEELKRAIAEMSGSEPELISGSSCGGSGIYLECAAGDGKHYDTLSQAYSITERGGRITISAKSPEGALYGAFDLIRRIRCKKTIKGISETHTPSNPLRMLNHWDNADGSIERGYSGSSFFFRNGELTVNERTRDYARLAASVGINAVVINNVNVKEEATDFITDRYFGSLRSLSEIFSDYGIRLFLSVNYASPIDIGGLDTADPCDERVIGWWEEKAAEIFRELPQLGGFLIKADSEGRPGPFTYGRNQAEGANLLARAIKPYGGILIWRCFVYNCRQDWRDRKTDRARAGYDYFRELDGEFDDNVILQIKNGPMDFQVREAISPLFGAMPETNQMLEVQLAQEYTGQQIDLCYLIPWFKEVLGFRTHRTERSDTVADCVSGKMYNNRLCGMAAVCNTGDDYNWTGHDLAAANFYGFGRLAFDTSLTAEEIAEEWIRLTLGNTEPVIGTISGMLLSSHAIYEKYTSPLGIGWMVTPHYHYGPDIDGYEYSRWGTYHYADRDGIGVDRTSAGTGYVNQYSRTVAELYESLESCPDELVLFFHHLPYTHVLHSGKTIIQHIYDTHFEGAEEAEKLYEKWKTLRPYIAEEVYERCAERFERQIENALEWRDVMNTYFYRKSGIADEKGRTIY